MPNHMLNIIEFRTEDLSHASAIIESISNENNELDFNRLIPSPGYLKVLEEKNNSCHVKQDSDWNYKHWKSHWNAFHSKFKLEERPDYVYGRVNFITLNIIPYPIFIAISKKYREIRFKVKFADQYAFGCDCGFLVFQNGQEIDCHVSPNEFESDEHFKYWEDIASNIY
ncbi:hypothetical protein P3655_17580 [Vibrio parahaemolyticus]|uniref:DUF1281 family ferredoxin-like fold protein n=1 Tax=Vibrio parahaemolyticus TaxID=670 RepID=UPI001FAC6DB1|nr:hypothetical protein [Vibrio parahaemolyticus]EJE4166747.1 hypothetical protein [Vibrio parahaemolyticus]MCI9706361.1 hypothetical protein [Vibrio parahaemolyticus]MCR9664605.1 hypothetical protein [Vibrio parahaemolyticus]MCR9677322.1 hypothetical protein [Vibrio parahaemolyticus]MDF4637441.1 hypothetical protein [Vibrio parahaemolyticus]